MVHPRRSLLKLRDTPYYHVTVRCVRRAWLAGTDAHTGKDYSHRKAWFLARAAHLSAAFCIDMCAYAIMHNYYEAVLHVDRARCAELTPTEIVQRWSSLFRPPALIDRWRQGTLAAAELAGAERLIGQWRTQLCDLSWFMRCLNQHLARRANLEDDCTGIFWETRFKSRAFSDSASLLAAMAYVDLSPVRLGTSMPAAALGSTSLHARIEQSFRAPATTRDSQQADQGVPLVPCGTARVPFAFRDYLELLDWTGRTLRTATLGPTEPRTPHLLQSLELDADAWLLAMQPTSGTPGRATSLERLRRRGQRPSRPPARISHKTVRRAGVLSSSSDA